MALSSLLLPLVLTASSLAQDPPPSDRVYCTAPAADFGVVLPGTKIAHTFVLVNPTASPVLVRKVVPTCQCTTAGVIEGKVIPARGSLEMPVTLQVPSTTGIKQAAVNMLLSTGAGPRLTLRAEAAYAVRTIPPFINAFDRPENTAGVIVLQSNDHKPFRVLSVAKAPPVFVSGAGPGDEPTNKHVVRYDLAQYSCEAMPRWILVETDHPDAPLVEMRVRHRCSKLKHQLQPGDLTLNFDGWIANAGRIPPGSKGTFSIEIKDFSGGKVDAVVSLSPDFRTAILEQRRGDGNRLQITAEVIPLTGKTGVFDIHVQFIAGARSEAITVVGTVR
jgi:hypothetical protein